MTVNTPYRTPPRQLNERGALRSVGLEIEFGGLSLERALEVVHGSLGGEIVLQSRTEGAVLGTRFGKFKVEFDHSMLRQRSYLRPLEKLGLIEVGDGDTAQLVEDSVLRVAAEIVPIEVVTPPIQIDKLAELDPLWTALRSAGAEDTHDSPLYAFGLHLNPETPSTDSATLLAFMRAFLLLEDWLVSASQVALTRRISPFIRPFPEGYRRLILQPDYPVTNFVEDYLTFSPTRNRPLDLAPLLVHLYGREILERIEEAPLVKPRPTYHYRMPNSEIASPGWTPARDWNRWLMVEQLADDPSLLRELSREYLATFDLPLRLQSQGWVETVQERLQLPL